MSSEIETEIQRRWDQEFRESEILTPHHLLAFVEQLSVFDVKLTYPRFVTPIHCFERRGNRKPVVFVAENTGGVVPGNEFDEDDRIHCEAFLTDFRCLTVRLPRCLDSLKLPSLSKYAFELPELDYDPETQGWHRRLMQSIRALKDLGSAVRSILYKAIYESPTVFDADALDTNDEELSPPYDSPLAECNRRINRLQLDCERVYRTCAELESGIATHGFPAQLQRVYPYGESWQLNWLAIVDRLAVERQALWRACDHLKKAVARLAKVPAVTAELDAAILGDSIAILSEARMSVSDWLDTVPASRTESTGNLMRRLFTDFSVWPNLRFLQGRKMLDDVGIKLRALIEKRSVISTKRKTKAGSQADKQGRKSPNGTRTDTDEKLIAALTQHHQYADRGCLNNDPIGNNDLARSAGVSKSTTSVFIEKRFGSRPKYLAACHSKESLLAILMVLNDEMPTSGILGILDDCHSDEDGTGQKDD